MLIVRSWSVFLFKINGNCVKLYGMKNIRFIFILASFFMFSCNVHDKSSDNAENVTLKQTVQGKFDEKLWTSPIEKDRLNQDISSVQSVSKNIALTPAIINSSSFAKNLPPVYPYLEGFSLIDENSVSEQVRDIA